MRKRGSASTSNCKFFSLGAHLHHFHNFAHQSAHVTRRVFHDPAASLDLGDVQYAVNQPEQVLAASVDDVQILALLFGNVSSTQQVGEAENRIQGRTQFVAHVGQECRLGAIGRFRGIFGDSEFIGSPQEFAGPLRHLRLESRGP